MRQAGVSGWLRSRERTATCGPYSHATQQTGSLSS